MVGQQAEADEFAERPLSLRRSGGRTELHPDLGASKEAIIGAQESARLKTGIHQLN
jgi:hypothetical protein